MVDTRLSPGPLHQRSSRKPVFPGSHGKGGIGTKCHASVGPDPVPHGHRRPEGRGRCLGQAPLEFRVRGACSPSTVTGLDASQLSCAPTPQASSQGLSRIHFSNLALTRKETYKWRCQSNCGGKCQTEIQAILPFGGSAEVAGTRPKPREPQPRWTAPRRGAPAPPDPALTGEARQGAERGAGPAGSTRPRPSSTSCRRSAHSVCTPSATRDGGTRRGQRHQRRGQSPATRPRSSWWARWQGYETIQVAAVTHQECPSPEQARRDEIAAAEAGQSTCRGHLRFRVRPNRLTLTEASGLVAAGTSFLGAVLRGGSQ